MLKPTGQSFRYATAQPELDSRAYEGAGHGFVRQQSGAANAQAAKEAWGRTVAFLKQHLEP